MLLLKHPRIEAREILRFSHPRVYHLHVFLSPTTHAPCLAGVRKAFIIAGAAVASPFVVVAKACALVIPVATLLVPVAAAGHGLTSLPLAAAADVVASAVTVTASVISPILAIVVISWALALDRTLIPSPFVHALDIATAGAAATRPVVLVVVVAPSTGSAGNTT